MRGQDSGETTVYSYLLHCVCTISPVFHTVPVYQVGNLKYEGLFERGRFEGKGSFFSTQFRVVDGTFSGGVLHGTNVREVFAPHGVIMKQGTYVNGKCTSEVLIGRDKLSTDPSKSWLPDAVSCSRCRQSIGWGSRHHCRTCGRSICGASSCSKFKDVLMLGTTNALPGTRVCADCYTNSL